VPCYRAIFFALKAFSPQQQPLNYCAFCDPNVLDNQKFYEDALVIALCTYKPILPGHNMVIPKRHAERFEMLTDEEILQMGKVIKKVNEATSLVYGTSAYVLLQKNGREVAQNVPHVHFHYIPRKAGDASVTKFFINMFLSNAKPHLSPKETREIAEKMKQAMDSLPK
jgi:Diadenosine tetraphosphate (Ap4A) hydrolase and other HIT family hydrolases